MTRLSRLFLLVLAALSMAWSASSVRAQGVPTDVVGGRGGAYDTDACPKNSLLVGMLYEGRKDINGVTPLCQQFIQGSPEGQPYKLRSWGTTPEPSGGPFNRTYYLGGFSQCPDGMVVYGMRVGISAGNINLVHDFALKCRSLTEHAYSNLRPSQIDGGDTDYTNDADCDDMAIANGVVVHHGALIDALGLVCLPVASVVPPAPPPAPRSRPVKSLGVKHTSAEATGSTAAGPPLVPRVSITGAWKLVVTGDEHYNLLLNAQGNGLMMGQDKMPFAVVGNLASADGSPDKAGTFSANMLPTRQLQGGYGQKNGDSGQCLLSYAADGQSLAGDCSRGQESIRWIATRGSWPVAPPATDPQRVDRGALRTVEVVRDVEVFDRPGGQGQVIAELRAKTANVELVQACQDDWCHVRWPDHEGWVYSGKDYNSLGQ